MLFIPRSVFPPSIIGNNSNELSTLFTLICDEISLGLAPAVIKDIYAALPQLLQEGVALILVEQDVNTALSVSDYAYCFMHGRVSLQGQPGALSKTAISDAYFGIQ